MCHEEEEKRQRVNISMPAFLQSKAEGTWSRHVMKHGQSSHPRGPLELRAIQLMFISVQFYGERTGYLGPEVGSH